MVHVNIEPNLPYPIAHARRRRPSQASIAQLHALHSRISSLAQHSASFYAFSAFFAANPELPGMSKPHRSQRTQRSACSKPSGGRHGSLPLHLHLPCIPLHRHLPPRPMPHLHRLEFPAHRILAVPARRVPAYPSHRQGTRRIGVEYRTGKCGRSCSSNGDHHVLPIVRRGSFHLDRPRPHDGPGSGCMPAHGHSPLPRGSSLITNLTLLPIQWDRLALPSPRTPQPLVFSRPEFPLELRIAPRDIRQSVES